MNVEDFFRSLLKMPISKSQLNRDLSVLRKEIIVLKNQLVPFTEEEMELLSFNKSKTLKKNSFSKPYGGIFTSIFYENLIAYMVKKYPNKQRLVMFVTSLDEFVYLTKGDLIHVYMNQVDVGVLTQNGQFYNTKNKVFASIDGADHAQKHHVTIQGKDIGFMVNPKFVSKSGTRAFQLLSKMNGDEKYIFLCLTLMKLLDESN